MIKTLILCDGCGKEIDCNPGDLRSGEVKVRKVTVTMNDIKYLVLEHCCNDCFDKIDGGIIQEAIETILWRLKYGEEKNERPG